MCKPHHKQSADILKANCIHVRAWNATGLALRHCSALGVHLKVKAGAAQLPEQRRRAELWYSLFALEALLAELTGRPRMMNLEEVTVSLDFSELQQNEGGESPSTAACWQYYSNNMFDAVPSAPSANFRETWSALADPHVPLDKTCFSTALELCSISHSIRRQYHSAGTVTWHDFHNGTKELHWRLTRWREGLPDGLSFLASGEDVFNFPAKISLFLKWASLNMMLFRPYVCAIDIPNESEESRDFDQNAARACVESALSLLHILTSSATFARTTVTIQWWHALHYTCQALGILLLEMSLGHRHYYPDNLGRIVNGIKDGLTYIEPMCCHLKSAFKLWNLSRLVLQTALQRYQAVNLVEIPATAPQPLNWTSEDQTAFDVLLQSLSASKIS